jgi:methyltransferase (TIGR00027 family)
VVVLGAGLDTLAWRLPSARMCFELDHPATQAIKRRVAAERPVLVAADLLHASVAELLQAQPQFDAQEPTLYVAEGLLMYLPPARVAELFREIAGLAAPRSQFAFSFMEARPGHRIAFHGEHAVIGWWLRRRSEVFQWALARENVAAFAAQNGWQLASLSSPEELRRRFLTPAGLADAPLATGESVALLHLRSS